MPPVTRNAELRRLLRRPTIILWSLFILLVPFYVVHNGLPQPGDLLILVLFPVTLSGWNGRLHRSSRLSFRPLVWFTLWVCVVELFWILVLGDFTLDLLFPAYYLYNAMIFLTALVLFQRFGEPFLRLTLYLFLGSVLFQVLASGAFSQSAQRGMLFFSNPNQLGYYALLAGCIIALLQRRVGLGLIKSSIGLTGCAYLAVLSASRSAAAGILLLFALLVVSNPRILAVGTAIVVALMLLGNPVSEATDGLQQRVTEDRNSQLTFFEQRGYDRIWANPEYLGFGAGEGANERFADSTAIGAAEIHSSAGTILFSYGIVGMGFLVFFVSCLVRGAPFRASFMLIPPLIYTFAHQGLRFTTLWVLLALFAAIKTPPLSPASSPSGQP